MQHCSDFSCKTVDRKRVLEILFILRARAFKMSRQPSSGENRTHNETLLQEMYGDRDRIEMKKESRPDKPALFPCSKLHLRRALISVIISCVCAEICTSRTFEPSVLQVTRPKTEDNERGGCCDRLAAPHRHRFYYTRRRYLILKA